MGHFPAPTAPGFIGSFKQDIVGFIDDYQTPYEIFHPTRPDLIYCTNGAPPGCYGAVVAARKLDMPFVISDGLIAEQFLGRNDTERAALKRRINEFLGSRIVEEKSYAPY